MRRFVPAALVLAVLSLGATAAPQGAAWRLVLDTNMAELPDGERFDFGHVYEVTARSLLLLELTG